MTRTFLCTNALAMVVFRRHFGWKRWKARIIFGLFGIIDLTFFSSNLLKVVDGGWVPLLIGNPE